MKNCEYYETQVVRDYLAHEGKTLFIHNFTAFVGDSDEQVDLCLHKPVAVRLDPNQANSSLFNWRDDWIDPYWDVTILDNKHPELPKQGVRSAYTYGPSYNRKTGEVECGHWRKATWNERLTFKVAQFFGW
jgi:hypothetical protein